MCLNVFFAEVTFLKLPTRITTVKTISDRIPIAGTKTLILMVKNDSRLLIGIPAYMRLYNIFIKSADSPPPKKNKKTSLPEGFTMTLFN